jgi:hypothetical protein
MPDPPTGLPFNAKPQSSEMEAFLEKYSELPALGVPFPNNNPQMSEDYNQVNAS